MCRPVRLRWDNYGAPRQLRAPDVRGERGGGGGGGEAGGRRRKRRRRSTGGQLGIRSTAAGSRSVCVCVWQGPFCFLPSNISRLAPPRMSDFHPGETARKAREISCGQEDTVVAETAGQRTVRDTDKMAGKACPYSDSKTGVCFCGMGDHTPATPPAPAPPVLGVFRTRLSSSG